MEHRPLLPLQPELSHSADDDGDPLAEPTFGSSVLEKLCIAIIRAHPAQPDDKRLPRMRLRDAVYSLQGKHSARGSNVLNDQEVLLRMAELLTCTRRDLDSPKREEFWQGTVSDSQERASLARAALKETGQAITKAALKRLSGKFLNDWKMLIQTINKASVIPHGIENRGIERIASILIDIGIPADVPDDPSLFWPLSSDK